MPIMTYRKTFILDEATAHRIKRLTDLWQVSQTEVLRRAVALAEREANLAGPVLSQAELEAGYRAMAADEAREAEAIQIGFGQ